jgi:hypothetical protein
MTRRGCIAAVLGATVGCGRRRRLEAVTGQVVFTDGQPVAGGVVEFLPDGDGRAARGAIGHDGRFTLKTGPSVGAQAGRYRVAVVHVLALADGAAGHGHRRVHARFARVATSDLTAEVISNRPNVQRIIVDAAEDAGGNRP